MPECQRELADSVKEDVKKEDAKNLEAELHRDLLQRGQGWKILDLMKHLAGVECIMVPTGVRIQH